MTQYEKQLRSMYLDWVNNYITIKVFAEHNGLTVDEAQRLVDLGKDVHERYVETIKQAYE